MQHNFTVLDMSIDDVRAYEGQQQQETNKRVLTGVELEEDSVHEASAAAAATSH